MILEFFKLKMSNSSLVPKIWYVTKYFSNSGKTLLIFKNNDVLLFLPHSQLKLENQPKLVCPLISIGPYLKCPAHLRNNFIIL